MIPFDPKCKAKLVGEVEKVVTCEFCGSTYAYIHRAKSVGRRENMFFVQRMHARNRAYGKALKRSNSRLENGCTPVPCPFCGLFQSDMVSLIKREHVRPLRLAALVLIPLSVFMFLMALTASIVRKVEDQLLILVVGSWTLTALSVFGSAGLFICQFFRSRTIDPNSAKDTDKRFAIAGEFATLPRESRKLHGQ